jgi:tryptophanyl-tRNA synthetase
MFPMSELEGRRLMVLSGIRPTGPLHLGNHLGAVRDWVELSESGDFDCYFFIANLHMLTTRSAALHGDGKKSGVNPRELYDDQIGLMLDLLAAGLDPNKAVIYAQSSIPELTELMWLLATLTPVARIEGMHHFKEKKGKLEEEGIGANAALLTYPVLMAADILGVRADIIPVGDDQRPHVEYARDVARAFNREYGHLFPEPDMWQSRALRVPSVDCSGKMGKSHPEGSVFYTDAQQAILAKFSRAVKALEDPPRTQSDWKSNPGDPAKCNVFSFYPLVGSAEDHAWAREGCLQATIPCGECKRRVAMLTDQLLAPIRERRLALETNAGRAMAADILHTGGQKARVRVQEVVNRAKEMVGVPAF